jgi:hypothetical protein
VEILIFLNNWTNNILLNFTALRLLYYFIKLKKLKTESCLQPILGFISILVLDNWFSCIPIDGDNFYYSFTASIFLSHYLTNKMSVFIQFCATTILGTMLLVINSCALTQICFILSMLILLFEIKNNLLKSSNQRRITTVLTPITAYIFFAAQEYTLAQVGQDWANSKLLIYFSIGDYIVFTTMIIIINANLRRLFFN